MKLNRFRIGLSTQQNDLIALNYLLINSHLIYYIKFYVRNTKVEPHQNPRPKKLYYIRLFFQYYNRLVEPSIFVESVIDTVFVIKFISIRKRFKLYLPSYIRVCVCVPIEQFWKMFCCS